MIAAVSEATTAAIVAVIISAIAGPLLVAHQAARTRRIESRLGVPNGAGNVAEMVGRTLHTVGLLYDGQLAQDAHLVRIDERLAAGDVRLAAGDARMTAMEQRLLRIESTCSALAASEEDTARSVAAVAGAVGASRRHDDPQPADPP